MKYSSKIHINKPRAAVLEKLDKLKNMQKAFKKQLQKLLEDSKSLLGVGTSIAIA